MHATLFSVSIGFLLMALIGWTLERLHPANPAQKMWRSDSKLDLLYWFFTPLITKALARITTMIAVVLMALALGRELDPLKLRSGFGPLVHQPTWLQAIEVIFLADIISYACHRMFHRGRLWPFHAIHHSSTQVDWLSAVRLHPVNDMVTRVLQVIPLFLLGFNPTILVIYVPFISLYAILLHANVPWDFGPFRGILASPVFHRWHHSRESAALNKNFAGFFPFIDRLFGTYYMPKDKLPTNFGVHDHVPDNFWGQLIHPFRRPPPRADQMAPPGIFPDGK